MRLLPKRICDSEELLFILVVHVTQILTARLSSAPYPPARRFKIVVTKIESG